MSIIAEEITATGNITTDECHYIGCSLVDVTGDARAQVYGSTATQSTATSVDTLAASDEGQGDHNMLPMPGVRCPAGIHVVLTGSGFQCIVYWVRG